jgi:hypothetical protein
MFKKLQIELKGKIALKVHSGEAGGKYFLSPDFLQEIYDYTKGTFVECNTAYKGSRHLTELHKEILKEHGWLDNNRRFVLMDEDPSKDYNLTVKNPQKIPENIVGEHLKEFDSCLVLSHVKGHSMGGFGGALKQLSIGFASRAGKSFIHSGGNSTDWEHRNRATQYDFTSAMGDAASSIVEYFRSKGGIAFINVIVNISKLCDCAGGQAPEPKIKDIGILASLDPVAIDRASVNLIKQTQEEGTEEWIEQITRLQGENTLSVAERHRIGTQDYNLINVDESTDESTTNTHTDGDSKEPEDFTTLYILIGVIGGLIFIALIILIVVIITRNKNKDVVIEKTDDNFLPAIKEA